MKLGEKPISEMSEDELLAAIDHLRKQREALKNESAKQKATAVAKEKAQPKPKAAKASSLTADMLAFLKGETEDL